MTTFISVHSFRRGSGKSTLAANLAALLAGAGRRVGVVEMNLAAPSLHHFFCLDEDNFTGTINDYLWGRCDIGSAATPVSLPDGVELGQLVVVPASTGVREIGRIVRGGYYVNLLADACVALADTLALDVVLIDTAAGLNAAGQLVMALVDVVTVILRLDQQDYQGTGIILDVGRCLGTPHLRLVVNEAPSQVDAKRVEAAVNKAYGSEVTAVLPHSPTLAQLGSQGLFVWRYPDHSLTAQLRTLTTQLTPL